MESRHFERKQKGVCVKGRLWRMRTLVPVLGGQAYQRKFGYRGTSAKTTLLETSPVLRTPQDFGRCLGSSKAHTDVQSKWMGHPNCKFWICPLVQNPVDRGTHLIWHTLGFPQKENVREDQKTKQKKSFVKAISSDIPVVRRRANVKCKP